MKRALLFIVAVIALMLVYPTATPAASPETKDTMPTMEIMTPRDAGTIAHSGDDDDGDADDLAGIKGKKTKPDGSTPSGIEIRLRSWAEVWRMYFITFRLYR
ncbi:MAG: hypothetical protein JSW50_10255 [Candidatus Latescibacterota bacterium]|nr:MAG: hypothetical protein JSW50_10255 [Candidatus Latescibacterota bacterium]